MVMLCANYNDALAACTEIELQMQEVAAELQEEMVLELLMEHCLQAVIQHLQQQVQTKSGLFLQMLKFLQ